MRRFTHEELLEMLPAYGIGALAPDEVAAVDAALTGASRQSEELRRELRAYESVATQVAELHATVPPAGARDRLLSRIAREKHATVTPPPASRVPRPWLVALAAALVLAFGLGAYSLSLRQALSRRESTLNAILEADRDLRVARVLSADSVNGPGIQFFWNEKQRRGVLHAFRMPPAPRGRSYQVWLLQDGKPHSISVFNSDRDGHALVQDLTLPPSSRGATLVLVTEEPAGGSPGPTTTPFMSGELSN